MNTMKSSGAGIALLAGLGLLAAGEASAATVDVYLRADAFTIPANTFNNPAPIMMWGFTQFSDGTFSGTPVSGPSAPGPALTATAGDTLNIHILNNLQYNADTLPYTEPVSVIVPGQTPSLPPASSNTWPCWTDGTCGPRGGVLTKRVRSFTVETPADGAMVMTYTWPSLKAGTYLYQSGTHPAVQVQMGLYGVLKVYAIAPLPPATSGQAYSDASSAFASEANLLFSEIDPVLHNAIECGNYGPSPSPVLQATNPDCPATAPAPLTSTVDYHPKYFLINGSPYTGQTPLPVGVHGTKVLLRFLNAGLDTKNPVVQGPYMSLIAEDGNFITATNSAGTVIATPKQQYSVMLPAGKTMDAILAPAAAGNIQIYDRRLNLTNNGAVSPPNPLDGMGGMFAVLSVN
jgi:FtsP/CotA-like multicopper oxidase with cupredoxin domain